jgi:hypothetical protein
VTFEAKKKRTEDSEEDSVVSCPKYSTDVECWSDSLAVISYRNIKQFTNVNLSDTCMSYSEITRLDSVNEAADLIKASTLDLLLLPSSRLALD